MNSIIEEFRTSMHAAGVRYDGEIIADGLLHRVKPSDGKSKTGWYILHADAPAAGSFGDWKSGVSETWCHKNGATFSAEERAEIGRKMAASAKARKAAEAENHAQARIDAKRILSESVPANGEHRYLVRKGIKVPDGVRIHQGNLVVPLSDASGTLHTLQFIDPDGGKLFLSGGRCSGAYFRFSGRETDPLAIVEGVATGATIHDATGWSVICAMNAGNLLPVAESVRQQWPSREIIICGDDDRRNERNTGREKATAAAKAINARLAFPQFQSDDGSDFNDLAAQEGLDTVRHQVELACTPHEGATDIIPEPIPWPELHKPVSYENNLLGDRFLERGQGLIFFGPAGCGKSVAAVQAQAWWAAGLDGLHIRPVRPLRITILQTEDSVDDMRETLAGILSDPVFTPELRELVERNLIVLPAVSGGAPGQLAAQVRRAVIKHRADLVSVNPLLAFCPADPSKELGGILYQHIDPVIKEVGAGFLGVHHTPKTNNRDTSNYGTHDWQYLAAGDARVANWPRAMIAIEEASYPVYRFRLAKRFGKSGWADPTIYMAHAKPVRWVDATEEQAGRAAQPNAKTKEDFLRHVPTEGAIPQTVLFERASKSGIGKHKARAFLDELLSEGALHTWLTKRKGTNALKSVSRHQQPQDLTIDE